MNMIGVDPYLQNIVKGTVLIAAVFSKALRTSSTQSSHVAVASAGIVAVGVRKAAAYVPKQL